MKIKQIVFCGLGVIVVTVALCYAAYTAGYKDGGIQGYSDSIHGGIRVPTSSEIYSANIALSRFRSQYPNTIIYVLPDVDGVRVSMCMIGRKSKHPSPDGVEKFVWQEIYKKSPLVDTH